jgi:hypothetical protein
MADLIISGKYLLNAGFSKFIVPARKAPTAMLESDVNKKKVDSLGSRL